MENQNESYSYQKSIIFTKKYKDAVKKFLEEDGTNIYFFDASTKNDYESILIAMKSNFHAYEFIGEKYKLDEKVIDLYWIGYIKEQERLLHEDLTSYQRVR